jgi:hyperosmotically inducible protein
MNTLLTKTLIASSIAFAAMGAAQAADNMNNNAPATQAPAAQHDQKSTMGRYVDDATITTKIKAKQAEDKVVSAMGIDVETKQGVVILSGKASSDLEKVRAEKLAKMVDGVKAVENDIVVQPKTK